MLLRNQSYAPNVISTCGHVYAMEHAPVVPTLMPPSWHKRTPEPPRWSEVAAVALQILDLVDSLDHDLEEAVQFCDMKPDNIGLSSDGAFKIIDIDSIFFLSDLEDFSSRTSCRTDRDCHFQYCLGKCNLITNTCEKRMINNNLQRACTLSLSYITRIQKKKI